MLPTRVIVTPVPPADDRTLCEVSCRLVGLHSASRTGCAKGLTYPSVEVDLAAIDKALAQHVPVVDIRAASDQEGDAVDDSAAGQAAGSSSSRGGARLLRAGAQQLLARLVLPPLLGGPFTASLPRLMAWHTRQQVLALGHSSSGAVLLYDLAGGGDGCMQQAQHVLTHQLQQQVSSLAWRPVNCSNLAVGCKGGVALWQLGKLPVSASTIHKGIEGSGAAGWVLFLAFKHKCRVTSLSWSPDGRLLAGSSADCNRIMVWDAALGVGASLRLGLQPVTTLAWSPDGNYLFAAARSGRFFLYETSTWSVRSWDTPPGAGVTAAAWAPDSSLILLALSSSSSLVALHLVGTPPDLTEQLLPVALPEVSDDPALQQLGVSGIRSFVWDPSGCRLAVVLAEPHPAAGTVALYSTSSNPVVTCHLIGYIQPAISMVKHADVAAPSGGAAAVSGTAAAGSGGDSSRLLQAVFSEAPGKAGALLSIGTCSSSSGSPLAVVRNVPMYF